MDTDRPVVLVTGGPSGVACPVVLRLVAEGYDVVLGHGREVDHAVVEETVAKAAAAGGRVVVCELAPSGAAVRGLVRETETEVGPVAAVVTCAAAGVPTMAQENWHDALADLDTTYHVCRAVIFSFMKRKAGSVVAVSSPAGMDGDPARPDLAAAAAGVTGFILSVAKECAGFGVRANAILAEPAQAVPPDSSGDPRMSDVAADVASLVAFLVSNRASSVNAQVLRVGPGPAT